MSPTSANVIELSETGTVSSTQRVKGPEWPWRNSWTAIELRHMTALEALAKERSFRAAADALGYVQSAVSQQLFALERVTGVRLVDRKRSHKQVTLTAAGALLLEHIEAITDRLAFARRELEALSAGRAGQLRIGVNTSAGATMLPPLIRAMTRRWPEIALELIELASDAELLAMVEDLALDASLVFSVPTSASLQGKAVLRDRFVLLVGEDAPLAVASPLEGFHPLAGEPLLVANRGHELAQLEMDMARLGLNMGPVIETGSQEIAIALAASGEGAAFLSRLTLGQLPAGMTVVELEESAVKRTLSLVVNQQRVAESPDERSPIERFQALARIVGDDIERALRPSPLP